MFGVLSIHWKSAKVHNPFLILKPMNLTKSHIQTCTVVKMCMVGQIWLVKPPPSGVEKGFFREACNFCPIQEQPMQLNKIAFTLMKQSYYVLFSLTVVFFSCILTLPRKLVP